MHWIDLAYSATERDLSTSLDSLDDDQRATLLAQLCALCGIDRIDFERRALRLLLERARPLALPRALWARPITSSSNVETEVTQHLLRLGVEVTDNRVSAARELYTRFVVNREGRRVTHADLVAQGFRCAHCGLAFCDEELTQIGLNSPFGFRGTPKDDKLKPHWSRDELRLPTIDHLWSISLYGTNDSQNIRVLCKGCNSGKANYIAVAQAKPFIGLPTRQQLLGTLPINLELFCAQIWRAPRCIRSGLGAAETELTVELKDPLFPIVLDNLITVSSPGN